MRANQTQYHYQQGDLSMKRTASFVIALVLAALTACSTSQPTTTPTTTASSPAAKSAESPAPVVKITKLDPALDKLLAPDVKVEKLADGYQWSEGPVWNKKDSYLLFSDIPNNRIVKWDGKAASDYLKPAGYTGTAAFTGREPGTNGLTYDAQGRLVACAHGDRVVVRLENDGKQRTVLAGKFEGKRFNSPNDLVYKSNGDLYFTDPPYGLPKGAEDPAREMDYCGVYRLAKNGQLTLLTKEVTRPNGIAFSPDEKTLYVASSDPDKAIWMAYPVKADGTLDKGKMFFDATAWYKEKRPGLPDGLKVDKDGNLWATGPGGVLIFTPEGKHLGTIDTGVPTANVGFGDDGSTLYITANHELLKVKTGTKGLGF
jgi:gluconolactonase